jgi:hypothetical protein
LIAALGMLSGAIYISDVKFNKSIVDKFNNFGNTPEAPFYLMFFFALAMSILIFFTCVRNKTLKEYNLEKYRYAYYENKMKKFETKYNRDYFCRHRSIFGISANLEYIHISLDGEDLKIADLF